MEGQKQKKHINQMWGGHYSGGVDEIMAEINASIDIDRRLYRQDIAGSLAHVQMLGATGILNMEEVGLIESGLKQILVEIECGEMEWKTELEDIHMHVEARLKEMIGEVAGKLHTARSRNDQVATDFRLFLLEETEALSGRITALQQVLLKQAEAHLETIMPGFTHLQTAQPVTFAHHLMAYVEMLERDKGRFRDAKERMRECPLGAAALAGTSFPLDRHMTADALGFARPCRNSLDAVSARDFAIEYVSAAAICLTHLSRLAEELILWSSPLIGFIGLPESFTSGSSIMPQKRNPDAAELIRGKTGRMNGHLVHLLTMMKGLPLAYNKDMQEDKEPVFDAIDTLHLALAAMEGMMRDIKVYHGKMLAAASGGFSTATDLADWLVRVVKIPFRDAHHITGKIVKMAEARQCTLWEVPLEQMQQAEPRITQEIYDVLRVEQSVASRQSYGGTSPQRVAEAIKQVRADYEL